MNPKNNNHNCRITRLHSWREKAIMMLLFIAPIIVINFSCKKFVTVGPPETQVAGSSIFTTDAMASAAMTGIYTRMSASTGFASGDFFSVTFVTALSADELKNYSTSAAQAQFFNNSLSPSNATVYNLWQEPYQYIYSANSILERLPQSTISANLKTQLEGEAKFIRAFCYFYLANIFGDIPLVTSTDYRVNQRLPKTLKSKIYEQIILDLKEAQNLLNDNYFTSSGLSTTERVRPNKSAVNALLARVYLYVGDWINAEAFSSLVINNTTKYNLVNDLNSVFLKNSKEAIWQLMPVVPGINTKEGNRFILTTTPSLAALSNEVLIAFESGDLRKNNGNWVKSIIVGNNTYYYPYKYKVKTGSTLTEYSMIFRLAEQYLIRAEARAQQNNNSGAQADLNVIRNRAALPNSTATDKATLLLAIEHERQVELFTEWGHRWFDLKRTNRSDDVLGPIKGANWQTTDVLYPIPTSEILINSNLTQNLGY